MKEFMRMFGIVVLTAAMAGLAFATDTSAWRELVGFGGVLCLLAALIIEP